MIRNSKTETGKQQAAIPLAEWLVAALGLVLVVASFGFLAFRAASEKEPPVFEASIESLTHDTGSTAIGVVVRNRGGRPVADLRIQATSTDQKQSEAVLDFLPSHSSRRVTFMLEQTTSPADVKFSFRSYTEP